MTKINKLGKSTFAIAILSFILVAVLAFGGTYAYFSDRADAVSGNITTGHLNILTSAGTGESGALKTEGTIVGQPNQIIFNNEEVTTTVSSNIAYFTRVRFNVVIDESAKQHYTCADGCTSFKCTDDVANKVDILKITFANGSASGGSGLWQTKDTNDVGTEGNLLDGQDMIYYQLAATRTTDDNYDASSGIGTEKFSFTIQVKEWVGNNGDNVSGHDNRAEGCDYWMDVKITVQVIVEVLQADYLLDTTGLKEAEDFATGAAAHAAWEDALGKTHA